MARRAKKKEPLRCRICGAPEKLRGAGGLQYSSLSPYSRICAKCINKMMYGDEDDAEDSRA